MPPMIQRPPPAANAAVYDKTQKSGLTGQHMVSRIHDLLTSLKGSTPDKRKLKPTYGKKQAAKVVGNGGAAPSPMSLMPGPGAATN